jgi:hypothetical protein
MRSVRLTRLLLVFFVCVQGTAMYLGVGVLCAAGQTGEGASFAIAACDLDIATMWETAVGADTPVVDRAPALRLVHLVARHRATCGLLATFEPEMHKLIAMFADASLYIS